MPQRKGSAADAVALRELDAEIAVRESELGTLRRARVTLQRGADAADDGNEQTGTYILMPTNDGVA